MKKIVLTFGLIGGAIMSAMFLITYPFHDAIGFDRALIIGYTSIVLAFLLIFFGVRSYRDNVGGGRIGFGRALGVGTLIALVTSLCYVAMWEVAYFTFAHDYMDKYQAHELEKARAKGDSEEAIARQQAEMEKFEAMYQNPLINAAMTLAEPLPVGLVVALVTAGILSRRRKDPMGQGA